MPRNRSARRPSWFREHWLSLALSGLPDISPLDVHAVGPGDASRRVLRKCDCRLARACSSSSIATKYLVEIGSREPAAIRALSVRVLAVAAGALVDARPGDHRASAGSWLYARHDVDGKSGQVIGNVVSDWTQVLGLVLITKYPRENGARRKASDDWSGPGSPCCRPDATERASTASKTRLVP